MSDAVTIVLNVLRGTFPLTVRLLKESESLPAFFEAGFDQLGQLDPQWVWVAERRGQIVGCIVSSPCHGVALIWRLVALPESNCLLPMCRRFMADCRKRGLKGYMTWTNSENETQNHLQRIIKRIGGEVAPNNYQLIAGPIAKEGI